MKQWWAVVPIWLKVGVVAGVLLLAGIMFGSCWPEPDDPMAPDTRRAVDSLDATKPDFVKTQDSLRRVIHYDTVRITVYDRRSEQRETAANITARRADSLARVADSAGTWRAAYEARTQEVGEVRAALADKDTALTSARQALVDLRVLYVRDTLRRTAVEDANAKLRRDMAQLERPCRIVGPIPCPSRTAVAVASGALGVVAGAVAGRASKG